MPYLKPPDARTDWAFFLDVDGTLIAISQTPDTVHVDATLLDLLKCLYDHSGGAVALVSGRSVADLEKRLGSLQLPLSGQHGLERKDSAGKFWMHDAPPMAMSAIRKALEPVLTRHSELLFEDKGLTLALHYRQAPALASYVHRLMTGLVREMAPHLELQTGKRVVEVKPSGRDKGTVIGEYMSELPFHGRIPVFIGDDVSDERGFFEINRRNGISIKVGSGRSCARFRLPDVAAVRTWLSSAVRGCS